MLYHASPIPDLTTLVPHTSNHGKPLVYFSQKRENVLVYLSNAVEKCCVENGFEHKGGYSKWGPYGFNSKGIQVLEEYYPNAVIDTYKGVSGYIYSVIEDENECFMDFNQIPFAKISENPVKVYAVQYIKDAYQAILEAAGQGKIILSKFEDNSPQKTEWIKNTVLKEYEQAENNSEYRFFLRCKFNFLL